MVIIPSREPFALMSLRSAWQFGHQSAAKKSTVGALAASISAASMSVKITLCPVLVAKRSSLPTFGSAVIVLEDIIEPVPPEEPALFIMLWPNASVEIERTATTRRIDFILRPPSYLKLNLRRLGHRSVTEGIHTNHAAPVALAEHSDLRTLGANDRSSRFGC